MDDETPKNHATASDTDDSALEDAPQAAQPEETIPHQRIDALEESVRARYKYWLGMLEQQRVNQLDEFIEAQQETAALLDQYSAQDDHDRERRRRALDAYFDLDRVLQKQQETPGREPRVTGPMLPAHRKRLTQAANKKRTTVATAPLPFELAPEGGSRLKLVIMGLVIALGLGVGAWRLVVFFSGPELDPTLAATKHVTPNAGSTGVDTEGKSVAVNEDLVAGAPVITHLRLFQDKKGNLRARATAIGMGGKPPTISFTWYQGDAPVKEGSRGLLEAVLVQSGKGYAVQAVARDGKKKSRAVRTKALVAQDKEK